jgi:dipeptidyl aminopeptidase/acylaminoacyl peptidase
MVALLVVSLFLVALPAASTVSGDNGKIAFVSDRDGNPDIYLMDPDGSNVVNLTSHPAQDHDPAWSPDGRQIAFASDRSGEFAIYVMKTDGSDVTFVVRGQHPAWSPDGALLAFARNRSIYVRWPDGTESQITDPSTDTNGRMPGSIVTGIADGNPSWSPDGTRIAFVRRYLGASPTAQTSQLFVTDALGSGLPLMLDSSSWNLDPPDWSPDGARIVLAEVAVHNTHIETVVVPVDGSGATRLPLPSGLDRSTHPAWSPDGASIITALGLINQIPLDLYKMSPDGSSPVKLTDAGGFDPAWQPLNPYPLGLVDSGTGVWHLRHHDGRLTSFYYGSPGDVPFLGDWDGDGVETPGLHRQSDGFIYLRNSNTQGVADIRFFFGNPGDIPLAGDFDGDGFDTISIYRPSEARIYVIDQLGSNDGGLGAAAYSYLFGNPGDKPFVGDFNGDGVDTVGLHRESTGMVYYRDSNTQGIAENTFVYGDPGDRLVAHDWNEDGRDSPAVFRPGNNTVYFRFLNANGVADAQYIWGAPGWLPVAGDFDQS